MDYTGYLRGAISLDSCLIHLASALSQVHVGLAADRWFPCDRGATFRHCSIGNLLVIDLIVLSSFTAKSLCFLYRTTMIASLSMVI